LIISVRAAGVSLIFILFAAAGGPCATLDIGLDGRVDLDGTLAMRVGAETGQVRAVFLYQGRNPSADCFRGGFSCPWLRAGPLSPAGLLRETENPCGYSAGSGVFEERTGLSLDASLPPIRSPALLLEPLPRHLGVFYRTADGGYDTRMGGFAALDASLFLSVEALVEFSRPSEGSMGDAWYARYTPYPGGLLVHAAGRTVWRMRPFTLTLSGGVSGYRRGPGGSFLNSQLAVGDEGLGADFLFSLAAKEYVTLDGGGSRDWLAAGGKLYVIGPAGSAILRGSLALAQEECAPHPYLATSWDFNAVLEKSLREEDSSAPRLLAEGEASYDFDAEGEKTPRKTFELGLAWMGGAGESSLKAGYGTAGPKLSSCLRLGDRTVSCSVDARAVFGETRTLMTALIGGRIAKQRSALSFQAGVRELPLAEGTRDFYRRFHASLDWQTGSSICF
jgi:hypothetical protein